MDDTIFNEEERSIVLTSDQALIFYGIESSRPFQINGRLANVGDMLRHAREHKKMSVDFLSSKINLDSKMIRQLESNQYDNLPGETYIRGYISLVARELGADIGPLLKVYEIQNPEKKKCWLLEFTFFFVWKKKCWLLHSHWFCLFTMSLLVSI